jgi:hypothetical protein
LFTIPVLRYMKTYGLTHEQLVMVSVVQREWAAKNPRATFKTPITVEDVLNSRMIAYPFGFLQCCLVADGGALIPSHRGFNISTGVNTSRKDLRCGSRGIWRRTPAMSAGIESPFGTPRGFLTDQPWSDRRSLRRWRGAPPRNRPRQRHRDHRDLRRPRPG